MSQKAKGAPFHIPSDVVHHNNAKCEEGKKVRVAKNRIDTDGGKPLCPDCQKLNA